MLPVRAEYARGEEGKMKEAFDWLCSFIFCVKTAYSAKYNCYAIRHSSGYMHKVNTTKIKDSVLFCSNEASFSFVVGHSGFEPETPVLSDWERKRG